MSKGRHMTAFYLETVLMVIIFVLVIAALAQVFSMAKTESRQAEQLTNAVCLAQNAAEAVAAAGSEEELSQLLQENGNVTAEKGGLTAWYDGKLQPVSAEAAAADPSSMRMEVSWEPGKEEPGAGTMVNSTIAVYEGAAQEPVYTLDTGVYLREEGAR